MGRKGGLTDVEKSTITIELDKVKSTLEIAKSLGRYHQTVKNYVNDPSKVRTRSDKGKNRIVSRRSMMRIKREATKNPGLCSKELFDRVRLGNVSKTTRCRTLRQVAKSVNSETKQPLKQYHIQNRLKWTEDNMKVDFSKVLFTDEVRVTLDGPDGWVINDQARHHRLRRQQGGGGIMVWAGINGGTFVGPWKVPEGVKMTANTYINFLKDNLELWLKKQKLTFRRSIIFMQDNAPSHAAKKTSE